ncbi:unnamed protein product [Leptidea sinapis]|uniref:K Homology domain-containing protein n=1 Tax=Leptidea sinapis TaxID=189913 RepID=A0A5E4QTW4_9NEOP|nr:unnamed protein product [Leptidea sinapis]
MKTKNKKKNKKITTKRLSIAKVATDFYKNLYTETDIITQEEDKEAYDEEKETPCILESEVVKAITSQKSGKASGEVKILVPNSTAGMIIGKGGNYIKQIKEQSGSYVQISQKAKELSLQERCITVVVFKVLY